MEYDIALFEESFTLLSRSSIFRNNVPFYVAQAETSSAIFHL